MNKQKRMEDVDVMLKTLEEDKKEPLMEVLIDDEEEDDFASCLFRVVLIWIVLQILLPLIQLSLLLQGMKNCRLFYLFRRKFFCEREN